MVITVSGIHESVDDIFHDVEIFTMETCHEIDMITLQYRFLNEAEKGEKPDGKIKQLVNAIINKAKELADKVSRTINEIIMTFYNKYANFRSGKLKKYPKEDMKDAINKAIDQYKDAKIYTVYNVSYHTIFDRLKSKNVDMTVESIMKNMDKRDIEYDDINNELTYNFSRNSIKQIRNLRDMFIKELKEKEDLSDEEYKNRVKAYMNIYTARLKMRVSNVKTMISVMKTAIGILKKGTANKNKSDSDDYHDHKFEAFNTEKFWKSIKDKDYLRLKVNFVSSMRQDPTFDRGDNDILIKIFDKEVPEIWENEEERDYEERLDEKDWDKRYFTKLTYWMQKNFAKSRLPYIRKVGKVVHRDTVEKYNKSREEFEEYKKKMMEKKLAEKRKIFKKKK